MRVTSESELKQIRLDAFDIMHIMGNMLSDQDVKRVAAEAFCDARTVRKHLAGEEVRLSVRERIEKAMKKLRLKKGSHV